ncbi:hypothetical protein RDWZM_005335 [Blomia tropicalis]|uniref:F-box domain-containing protein n=1 Tax=Blomia tropicalis TaxID=40697 RepID=A0A9Q0M6L2_BLOTA|nr:hypothetical protein RDWZM_005335 [Blomia tropicalis]
MELVSGSTHPKKKFGNIKYSYKQFKSNKCIDDLPALVIEYILSHFPIYDVLRLRFVSRYWNKTILGYLEKADKSFVHNLNSYNVQWVSVKEVVEDFNQSGQTELSLATNKSRARCVPKMSPRFHHCAVNVQNSMYIFGGCVSRSTAYNDLWRFDGETKKWYRIISGGTHPLPRLFCSFTYYERRDETTSNRLNRYIVLFGGILFDEKLDIKERLLSTIHLYDIDEKCWNLVKINGEQLFSGNHSAVILGDELIVFNGLRLMKQREVESHEIYIFDLKNYTWRQQKTQITSGTFVRTPIDSYRNQPLVRRKMVQTPFVIDNHNILYIYASNNTNVLYLNAFLLKRSFCGEPNCGKCVKFDETGESKLNHNEDLPWQWVQVDISKSGLDGVEFSNGGQFCKIGNLLAYLTVKNVPILNHPFITPINVWPQLVRQQVSHINKRQLHEVRIKNLDIYREYYNNSRNNRFRIQSDAFTPKRQTLQLRLLDTSKIIGENRIFKLENDHMMDCSVSPEVFSCYSLVSTDKSILLFGGYLVDQTRGIELVSNKVFMIMSKPKRELH